MSTEMISFNKIKCISFTAVKNRCMLHGRVFVMKRGGGGGGGLLVNCVPMLEQRTAKLTRNILKLITPFHCIQSKINPSQCTFFLPSANFVCCTAIVYIGCIMNGRNCLENNFTYVGTQGVSVVDYCFTPYEHLSKYEGFRVCLTSDLLNNAKLHNKIDSATSAPDHSLLLWTFTVERTNVRKKGVIGESVSYEKYDRLVLDNFLQEDLSILNDGIRNIQQSVNTQEVLDNVCSRLISTLKTEMNDKMTHRTVKIQPSGNNKKRKVNKPWWSDSLSELWNEQCKAEKAMLKCQNSIRNRLRHVFVTARKRFNREVQRAKRQYIRQKQAEIDELQSKNQTMFWKEIGKIGVGQERRKNIPLEILKPDGSVSSDVTEVLGKWESDFESLLNPFNSTSNPELVHINMHSTQKQRKYVVLPARSYTNDRNRIGIKTNEIKQSYGNR